MQSKLKFLGAALSLQVMSCPVSVPESLSFSEREAIIRAVKDTANYGMLHTIPQERTALRLA